MCLYPKLIDNKKYIPNEKNGGNVPIVKDARTLKVPVGCGNCIECRKKKSREWQVRLNEEIRVNKNAHFVTLTFSEPALYYWQHKIDKSKLYHKLEENETATIAIRNFLENWRKKYKKSVKHWLITELGHTGTERIHIHGLIWTDEPEEIKRIWNTEHVTFDGEIITNGFADTGKYVNEKTINYIVKYITKLDKKHKGYKPKIHCSHGLGSSYLNRIDKNQNKYNGNKTKEYYQTRTGTKLNLPIYYRNKIYTDDQRENLWLNKLDENIRWICGEKIDISKNEDNYYKTLEFYQAKNNRLGFGDNTEEWSIKMYKKARKNLKRLQKNKRK